MSIIFFNTCKKESDTNYSILSKIPKGFPQLNNTKGNDFSLDRWKLGKALFYEKLLSKDSTISCASCHKIDFAFSDNQPTTKGVFKLDGIQNSPTLTNIGFQPYYTREGGIKTLEQQVLIPMQEHNEMNLNILDAGKLLNKIPFYKDFSLKAYDREMDYFVITRAISCFERSFISGESQYDKFLAQEGNISESALNGEKLFYSNKTNCSKCHSGKLFTNFEFYNNGLYQNYKIKGRYRLTKDSTDIGVFKVPTLRNVSVSAPYMHDGSIKTLKDVVNHYNNGGKIHKNKSLLIKPLNLSENEITDLVNFLESLTDYSFLNNKFLKNE